MRVSTSTSFIDRLFVKPRLGTLDGLDIARISGRGLSPRPTLRHAERCLFVLELTRATSYEMPAAGWFSWDAQYFTVATIRAPLALIPGHVAVGRLLFEAVSSMRGKRVQARVEIVRKQWRL